jgi:hypothetical protein
MMAGLEGWLQRRPASIILVCQSPSGVVQAVARPVVQPTEFCRLKMPA